MFQLLVTANVPSSLIHFALMLEAVRSAETSVRTIATRRRIPEEDILQRFLVEKIRDGHVFGLIR
jgi:hypothetical protein